MSEETDIQSIRVTGIEAVQVVQSESNDIPLVSGKPTWVRVYVDGGNLPDGVKIAGSIEVIDIRDGDRNTLDSLDSNNCARPGKHATLQQQRLDWSQSINFLLPQGQLDKLVKASVGFKLTQVRASVPGRDVQKIEAFEGKPELPEIAVLKGPEMICRIVFFKHRDRENLDFLEPTLGEAAAIRRFVECAFPAGKVTWSMLTVAAPRRFKALEPVARDSDRTQEQLTRNYIRFFLHLLQLREQDIVHGRDQRTLYLGLLYDPSGRFGGAAMDSPQFAAPHVVALTTPDADGQLGAHELAHVLGRRHPGVPDRIRHGSLIGQKQEPGSLEVDYAGETYQASPCGSLSAPPASHPQFSYYGLDTRYRGGAPRILAHDQYFDLMTYRTPKWVSSLTYLGILERLRELAVPDGLKPSTKFEPLPIQEEEEERQALDRAVEGEWSWTVIGEYDLEHRAGRIHYLGPGNYRTPIPTSVPEVPNEDSSRRGLVKLAWDSGEGDADEKPGLVTVAVHIRDLARLDGSQSYGVFQHTLSRDTLSEDEFSSFRKLVEQNGALQLLVKGVVADELRQAEDWEVGELFGEISKCVRKDLPVRPPPLYGRDLGVAEAGRLEKGCDDNREIQGGMSLQYSLDDGGYYLRYVWYWPEKVVKHLRITTSIACQRKRYVDIDGSEYEHSDEPEWETVAVSDRLSGRVWISPVFFDEPNFNSNSYNPEADIIEDSEQSDNRVVKLKFLVPGSYVDAPMYVSDYAAIRAIEKQQLKIRIGITIGFRTRYEELDKEVRIDEFEAFGSRNYGSSYLPYPGGHEEEESEYWYRDTGTDPEDIARGKP